MRLLAGKTAVVLVTTLLLQLLLCALALQSAPGRPVPVNYTNSTSINFNYTPRQHCTCFTTVSHLVLNSHKHNTSTLEKTPRPFPQVLRNSGSGGRGLVTWDYLYTCTVHLSCIMVVLVCLYPSTSILQCFLADKSFLYATIYFKLQ